MRGPRSDVGWQRLESLRASLSVAQVARGLFGWHADMGDERLARFLIDWLGRLQTQDDYNSAVDFMALALHRRPDSIAELEGLILQLVQARSRFPTTGQQDWDWAQLARRSLGSQPAAVLDTLLSLIKSGTVHAVEGSQDNQLLREVLVATGPDGLSQVLDELSQRGSWGLSFAVRGWLADLYETAVITGWIADSVDRARLIASVAGVGEGSPSDTIRYLLDHFGDDEQVSSSLYGDFVSGFWMGNESDRLAGKIDQLTAWVNSSDESAAVKRWARRVIALLKQRRQEALEREAEEGF